MSETVIVALLSLLGTLGGTLGGILATSKLSNYRIEQLEKKGRQAQQSYRADVQSGGIHQPARRKNQGRKSQD